MDRYLDAVSTYAGDIDGLVKLIAVIVGFWFLVAEGVFFGFLWKFRAREGVRAQYVTGEEKHQKRWITIPHYLVLVCDLVILVGAIRVWVEIKQTLPPADETVRVIGQQWAWSFVQPGPDKQLGTRDDIRTVDDLHIKVDTVYHFKLESRDVLHSFSVPVFRLKQDAIPGREITGWFRANKTGTFAIQCAEICGAGHGIMAGQVVIESPSEHTAWMKSVPAMSASAVLAPGAIP